MDGRAIDTSIWQAPGVEAENFARAIVGWSITIKVIMSMGTFHAALLPTELTLVQQAVALLLVFATAFVSSSPSRSPAYRKATVGTYPAPPSHGASTVVLGPWVRLVGVTVG